MGNGREVGPLVGDAGLPLRQIDCGHPDRPNCSMVRLHLKSVELCLAVVRVVLRPQEPPWVRVVVLRW